MTQTADKIIIKAHIDTSDVERCIGKITELIELTEKANSLIDELASRNIELKVDF